MLQPREMGVDLGAPRTLIYVTNTGASGVSKDFVFVDANGTTVTTVTRSIPGNGTAVIDLAGITELSVWHNLRLLRYRRPAGGDA
ncbi:MAG: hypothetical protein HC829_07740 [Bacteroidales bacterium]|nr:hypothetical protein [Bacteroidales bacterium]